MRPGLVLSLLVGVSLGCAGTPKQGVTHTLRSGETVYRLSRYYDVPVRRIVKANRIRDVSAIPAGARLFIPGARRKPPRGSLVQKASHTPSDAMRVSM